MLTIRKVTTQGQDLEELKKLVSEYTQELNVDLAFQNINDELANLLLKLA